MTNAVILSNNTGFSSKFYANEKSYMALVQKQILNNPDINLNPINPNLDICYDKSIDIRIRNKYINNIYKNAEHIILAVDRGITSDMYEQVRSMLDNNSNSDFTVYTVFPSDVKIGFALSNLNTIESPIQRLNDTVDVLSMLETRFRMSYQISSDLTNYTEHFLRDIKDVEDISIASLCLSLDFRLKRDTFQLKENFKNDPYHFIKSLTDSYQKEYKSKSVA